MALYLIPFHYVFPEVAAKETRVLTILQPQAGLPPDAYDLWEFYCPDPACDCRRVMLNVASAKQPDRFLASIGYGFDRDDEMAGPYLDPLNRQSQYAPKLFELLSEVLLHDRRYVARLERHYAMIKQAAADPTDPAHRKLQELEAISPERTRKPQPSGPRIGRNDPCPCGSGKKYKQCCGRRQ